MKFLLVTTFFFYSVAAFAQTEESLFPELDQVGLPETNQASKEQGNSDNDTVTENSQEQDLFKQQVQSDTKSETPTSQEEVEETEEEKDQHIYIFIDDVNATLTPNRNASFCTASFAVVNGLKKQIQSISGNFTIGFMTKQFKFNNIEKEQAGASKYTFVGTACEQIVNEPAYTIETCQVEGWSEKKCKEKVEFLKLQREDVTLE